MAQDNPLVLYLDMNVWIQLTKGRLGKSEDWLQRFRRLFEATRCGSIKIPLSSAHYLELWNRGNELSRTNVAETMKILSDYSTIKAIHQIQALEVRSAVNQRLTGIAVPLSAGQVLGRGVNHAFGSTDGRLRLVNNLQADSEPVPASEAPEEWRKLPRMGLAWEWLHLAGVQSLLDSAGIDRTPEHRIGEQFARDEEELRACWNRNPDQWKYRADIIVGQEFLRILDDINAVAQQLRIDPHKLFFTSGSAAERRKDIRDFLKSVPTAWTFATLRDWKHRDKNLAWGQHDRTDLIGMSCAVPYCDVVVTEKLWSHLVTASKLSENFATKVYSLTNMDDALSGMRI
ncbi:hypothetical protein ACIQC5_05375 [Paenarthrobacter sp. NPDC092416]|uniref:hypothetical protein n=1 Tax=Paenarthrobacter sp. NPDC092416 TaxID=3364386 RepID=UPI00380905CC